MSVKISKTKLSSGRMENQEDKIRVTAASGRNKFAQSISTGNKNATERLCLGTQSLNKNRQA